MGQNRVGDLTGFVIKFWCKGLGSLVVKQILGKN